MKHIHLTALLVIAAAAALPAYAGDGDGAKKHGDKTSEVGEAVSDTWITTKVKSDLLATGNVPGTTISVDTKDGVVKLSGDVKSQAEADKAVEVAKGIKGVKSVQSELKVGASDSML